MTYMRCDTLADPEKSVTDQILELRNKVNKYYKLLHSLSGNLASGVISRDDYALLRERYQTEIKSLESNIEKQEEYEQYVSGEIDTDAYNRMTERITVVEKDLVTRQKEIEKSRKITEKLCKKNFSWLAEFSKGKNLEFLTKDVVRSYIKKISLYEDKRIEIEFKFQDEIQALSEILEEGVIRCQMVNA